MKTKLITIDYDEYLKLIKTKNQGLFDNYNFLINELRKIQFDNEYQGLINRLIQVYEHKLIWIEEELKGSDNNE